MALARANAVIE